MVGEPELLVEFLGLDRERRRVRDRSEHSLRVRRRGRPPLLRLTEDLQAVVDGYRVEHLLPAITNGVVYASDGTKVHAYALR
ncbi:MAG: hypothetical protein M3Q30_00145 [Actinomycetota bacterium]|nr:hypothetical protein [Actinomycetota bacterium]